MILNPYSSLKPNDKIPNLVHPFHFYQLNSEQLEQLFGKTARAVRKVMEFFFSKVTGYNLTKKGLTQSALM